MKFRPGQSGNPAGTSPAPKIFSQALITALKRTDENDVEAIQRLADKLVNHALTTEPCDVYAIKEIADRVEGKSVQRMAGDDDEPITALTDHMADGARTNSTISLRLHGSLPTPPRAKPTLSHRCRPQASRRNRSLLKPTDHRRACRIAVASYGCSIARTMLASLLL